MIPYIYHSVDILLGMRLHLASTEIVLRRIHIRSHHSAIYCVVVQIDRCSLLLALLSIASMPHFLVHSIDSLDHDLIVLEPLYSVELQSGRPLALLCLSAESVVVENGLLLLEEQGSIEVDLGLRQGVIRQSVRLQLQLLQRQLFLLLLSNFGLFRVKLLLVILLICLLLLSIQDDNASTTSRIQWLDDLQTRMLIVAT